MAVKKINNLLITKVNPENPNFKQEEVQVEVNGNIDPDFKEKKVLPEENLYGERKHTYIPDKNGNLQMEQLMGKLMSKLDNFDSKSQTGIQAVEIDIKKEIAIGKVDLSAVKSEEVKGKVNNKLDKLKKLRRRNGR
tara:strand:- start:200 stop:607 length:408 start_codon:yes stop_codon:yes gene_type:complete